MWLKSLASELESELPSELTIHLTHIWLVQSPLQMLHSQYLSIRR